MKHPCMTMCWASNGTVIRTRYEKWEEPPRVGGGRGEGMRMGLLAPLCRMANTFECPCSASPPADPKLVSEDTNKMFVLLPYYLMCVKLQFRKCL